MFGKITQKMGKILLTRCVFFMILNFFTKKQCPNLDVHCLYFMHFLQNKMNKYWCLCWKKTQKTMPICYTLFCI